jgi:hypothetical protein
MIDEAGTDILHLKESNARVDRRISLHTTVCFVKGEGPSDVGILRDVGATDGFAKAQIEPVTVYDHLLRMHGLDSTQRNREIACVLHVDDELGPAMRRDPAHGTERLVRVGNEHLEALLDLFIDHKLSPLR